MNPTTSPLSQLLTGLVASGDPLRGAYGHNYLFEERVASGRQEDYEAALRLPDADLRAWKDRHKSYLSRKVYVGRGDVPETFTALNAERLVAEILHRRIDYTPDHLLEVGWITTRIPPHATGPALARRRNGHLFCLRFESERDDFGADLEVGHG